MHRPFFLVIFFFLSILKLLQFLVKKFELKHNKMRKRVKGTKKLGSRKRKNQIVAYILHKYFINILLINGFIAEIGLEPMTFRL